VDGADRRVPLNADPLGSRVHRFAESASIAVIAGGCFGYLLAIGEWLSLATLPFELLYGYAIALFPLAALTIITIGQRFRDDFPLNRSDSLSRVASFAPPWSKLLAAAACVVAVAAPLLTAGGSIQLSHAEWAAAPHSIRAAFFVAFAAPWFIVLVGLKAVAQRSDA